MTIPRMSLIRWLEIGSLATAFTDSAGKSGIAKTAAAAIDDLRNEITALRDDVRAEYLRGLRDADGIPSLDAIGSAIVEACRRVDVDPTLQVSDDERTRLAMCFVELLREGPQNSQSLRDERAKT